MEFACGWNGSSCIAMRLKKRKFSCCVGCRYASENGCIHPKGLPNSCRLWLCEVAEEHMSSEAKTDRLNQVMAAQREGRLLFREHHDTTRVGEKIVVPIIYLGELFLIPAFIEDAKTEGAKS